MPRLWGSRARTGSSWSGRTTPEVKSTIHGLRGSAAVIVPRPISPMKWIATLHSVMSRFALHARPTAANSCWQPGQRQEPMPGAASRSCSALDAVRRRRTQLRAAPSVQPGLHDRPGSGRQGGIFRGYRQNGTGLVLIRRGRSGAHHSPERFPEKSIDFSIRKTRQNKELGKMTIRRKAIFL